MKPLHTQLVDYLKFRVDAGGKTAKNADLKFG
jgi:hypothetical protein